MLYAIVLTGVDGKKIDAIFAFHWNYLICLQFSNRIDELKVIRFT